MELLLSSYLLSVGDADAFSERLAAELAGLEARPRLLPFFFVRVPPPSL